jgi:hypothetical protein
MQLCNFIAASSNAKNRSAVYYNFNSNLPVAVCPLFVSTNKGRLQFSPSKKIAESFYASGPAIISSLKDKKRRELIQYIGEVIEAILQKEKISTCKLSSANLSEYCLTPDYSYTNPWHELRSIWKNEAAAYYYLNLNSSVEDLKLNLETRTRTIINTYEKNEACTIVKAGAEHIDTVYNLFLETLTRAGLPIHSKQNFLWWLSFEHAEHYIAYINQLPVCVIRLLRYKNTALYSAGFTATDFVKTDIATYLLWCCILQMKQSGAMHFELGAEEFNPIGSKGDNIAKFKRGFGGVLKYKFSSVYETETLFKKWLKKFLARI